MPLRAFINDNEILSFEQTDEEWIALKKEIKSKGSKLLLSCCKQDGFLRTSSKGVKHFVHARSENTCDWKPESQQHLRAKMEIISVCKENGWHAIPEFSDDNWRADVLAVQDKKRIAFEVQWSKQTFEETIFRQDRYKESNVRGCWFFRDPPKEMREYDGSVIPQKEIPAFKIFENKNSSMVVHVNHCNFLLKEFVDDLLRRRFRYCDYVRLRPKQQIVITFFKTHCWKCKKPQHCWTVSKRLLTICNQGWDADGIIEDIQDFSKHPEVYKEVKKFLQTEIGSYLRIGRLKNRYSHTLHESYLSHGCFYCDALFGEHFISIEKAVTQDEPDTIKHKVEIDIGNIKEELPHWCYSNNGHFCE